MSSSICHGPTGRVVTNWGLVRSQQIDKVEARTICEKLEFGLAVTLVTGKVVFLFCVELVYLQVLSRYWEEVHGSGCFGLI